MISVGIELRIPKMSVSARPKRSKRLSLSLSIHLRYSPITADLPPKIYLLSAKLQAPTTYNVDSNQERKNEGVYSTSFKSLKPPTPLTSAPLWLEDSSSSDPSFISNLLVPVTLPPVAGTTSVKGQKVLIPSFESCLISRSYEI